MKKVLYIMNVFTIDAIRSDGYLPITKTVIQNNWMQLKRMIYYGADINLSDDNDYTALQLAVSFEKPNLNIIWSLVTNFNLDINKQMKNTEYTALMLATTLNIDNSVMRILLEFDADPAYVFVFSHQ